MPTGGIISILLPTPHAILTAVLLNKDGRWQPESYTKLGAIPAQAIGAHSHAAVLVAGISASFRFFKND